MRIGSILWAAAAVLVCGCGADNDAPVGAGRAGGERAGDSSAQLSVRPVECGRFDGVSCFDVAESDDGAALHLLLGTSAGGEDKAGELSYRRSDDGGATWSAPVAVPTSHAPPTHMHRGDDPQLAVRGTRVIAVWPAKGDGPYGSGPLGVALSDDAGRTWKAGPSPTAQPLPAPPPAPTPAPAAPKPAAAPAAETSAPKSSAHKHAPGPSTGPGYRFPAAAVGGNAFHIVWIYASGEERSLRYSRLAFDNNQWAQAAVIDPQICACCWNKLKVAKDGTLSVLYRDVKPSDMKLATSADGGATWQGGGTAGAFGWQFDGCPHVGGGLVALDGPSGSPPRWLTTVWTGAKESAGAYVASPAGGSTLQLAAEGGAGRDTDVAANAPGGVVAAVWDQSAGEAGPAVFWSSSADGGATWTRARRLSREGAGAAYPRVVPAGRGFLVAWTLSAGDGEQHVEILKVTPPG
jgi:hypothetical protein